MVALPLFTISICIVTCLIVVFYVANALRLFLNTTQYTCWCFQSECRNWEPFLTGAMESELYNIAPMIARATKVCMDQDNRIWLLMTNHGSGRGCYSWPTTWITFYQGHWFFHRDRQWVEYAPLPLSPPTPPPALPASFLLTRATSEGQ